METTPFKPADTRMVHKVNGHTLYLRLAAVPSVCGEKLSIRILDRERIDRRLHQLGLSDAPLAEVTDWLSNISGLFLVAGPTGSGKTTTLYALLHELKLRQRSIVTIENPVRYQVDGNVQIQADVRHGLDLEQGLRTMLRLDPDYLLLGEIRTAAAARAALESAGSGRVLMSTIHSADAVGAVTSLRNLGLQDHEIATSLRLVVAQRLVRVRCGRCRRRAPLTAVERQWLQSVGLPTDAEDAWHAAGCDECRHLGYQGRIGAEPPARSGGRARERGPASGPMQVSTIMASPAIVVPRTASLEAAAILMLEHRIACLPVVDAAGRLAGILTESDFSAKECGVPFSSLRLPQLFRRWMPHHAVEQIYQTPRAT